jgi:uncharacterized protein (TIGR00297 family)
MLLQLLIGFTAALVIALAAYRAHSLSRSGAWGALVTGTLIFGLGGLPWAVLLMGFFVSSSLLTRLFKRHKSALDEKFEKGGQRDLGQVLANGGVASVFVVLHALFPQAGWTWTAFAASLAAVNADTWATELGVLNPSRPRLITSLKPVERGTSGGISLYGTGAALGGAALIAGLASLFPASGQTGSLVGFLLLTLAGLAGALIDSLLGATLQAIYRCPQCDKETEKHPRHSCGMETIQLRGLRWMNNDVVNLCCALSAGLIGLLI